MKPCLQLLEDRLTPSVTFSQQSLTLFINANGDGQSHNVLVRPVATTPQATVQVIADGAAPVTFSGIANVVYNGSRAGNDVYVNRVTGINNTVSLGNGNNTAYVLAPFSFVTAGDGNNILQVTGGNSFLVAGNGNDNVYGGPGDFIQVGSGVDVVYDILPGTQSINVAPHAGIDHLFVGPQSTLTGAQPQDHAAQFFVAAPIGSGTLALSNNTLYYAATNQGDLFLANPVGNQVQVIYGPMGAAKVQYFAAGSFNQFAVFGGAGNDEFINNTSIDDVMYGQGGQNFIEGGTGAFTLIKEGGNAAGGSVAIARAAYNDVNGSGVTTAANTLLFLGGPNAVNIARTNSPADALIGLNTTDRVVSLYPDFVTAAFLPPFVPA